MFNKFIKQLYNNINNYNNSWNQVYNNLNVKSINFTNEHLENIPNINNYDTDILHNIKGYNKQLLKFCFYTPNRKININAINCNNNLDVYQIKHNFKLIYIWFHIIEKFTNIECSQNLNIYLFYTPLLKLLPINKGDPISTYNANTAFTFSCNINNYIHIFRSEEWFKVLIHECFHCLGLDFSNVNYEYNNTILSLFPLNLNFKIYESYCEFWAVIINSIFYCFYNYNHNTNFLKNFENIINNEINFSLFQCNKILIHFNMNYSNFFNNDKKSINIRLNNYKENTPIFAYFFIKTILLYFYKDFLKWCFKNNDNNNPLLFNKNITNINAFIKFIEIKYKNITFINKINNYYQTYYNNYDINNIYNLINLRMTITDIHDYY